MVYLEYSFRCILNYICLEYAIIVFTQGITDIIIYYVKCMSMLLLLIVLFEINQNVLLLNWLFCFDIK